MVKKLGLEENVNGYIHLKTIPSASPEIITEAGWYVDRMSINLEMPTEAGLQKFAPEKSHAEIQKDLAIVRDRLIQLKDERQMIRHVPNLYLLGKRHKWWWDNLRNRLRCCFNGRPSLQRV